MMFMNTDRVRALAAGLLERAEECERLGDITTLLAVHAQLDCTARRDLDHLADRLRAESVSLRLSGDGLQRCRPEFEHWTPRLAELATHQVHAADRAAAGATLADRTLAGPLGGEAFEVLEANRDDAAFLAGFFNRLGAAGTGALLTGLDAPPVDGYQQRVDLVAAALALASRSIDPPLGFTGVDFVLSNEPAAAVIFTSGRFDPGFAAGATAALLQRMADHVPGTPPGWALTLEDPDHRFGSHVDLRVAALHATMRSGGVDLLLDGLAGRLDVLVHQQDGYADDGYLAGEILAQLGAANRPDLLAEAIRVLGAAPVQEGIAHGATFMLAPHLGLFVDRDAYLPDTGAPGVAAHPARPLLGPDSDAILDDALGSIYAHEVIAAPLTAFAYRAAMASLHDIVLPLRSSELADVVQVGNDWGSIVGRLERAEFADAVHDASAADARNGRIVQAINLTIGVTSAVGSVGAAPTTTTLTGALVGQVRGTAVGELRGRVLSELFPTDHEHEVLLDKIEAQAFTPISVTYLAAEILADAGHVSIDPRFLDDGGRIRFDLDDAGRADLFAHLATQPGWQNNGTALTTELSAFGNALLVEGLESTGR